MTEINIIFYIAIAKAIKKVFPKEYKNLTCGDEYQKIVAELEQYVLNPINQRKEVEDGKSC